jgi:hypothetical protein
MVLVLSNVLLVAALCEVVEERGCGESKQR